MIEYFVEYCQPHIILLWICIMLCNMWKANLTSIGLVEKWFYKVILWYIPSPYWSMGQQQLSHRCRYFRQKVPTISFLGMFCKLVLASLMLKISFGSACLKNRREINGPPQRHSLWWWVSRFLPWRA